MSKTKLKRCDTCKDLKFHRVETKSGKARKEVCMSCDDEVPDTKRDRRKR